MEAKGKGMSIGVVGDRISQLVLGFLFLTSFGVLGGLVWGGSGCTQKNPAYCDQDSDCESGRCNVEKHACEPRPKNDAGPQADGGGRCSSHEDCTDPSQPICGADGTCRKCFSSSECEEAHPDKPQCTQEGVCAGESCGNGQVDGAEVCDGENLNGATCQSVAGLSQGTLGCGPDCLSFDTSDCHECGNGIAEGPELCDGTDFKGASCQSEAGLAEGSLSCQSCVSIDTSGCHQCGNGTVEGPEQCDGTNLNSQSCETVAGLADGALLCDETCHFDTSQCHDCGNGQIDGPEVCDGQDFGGKTCQDWGKEFGTLRCAPGCMMIDTSQCHNCGNGTCDAGEDSQSCPEDCGWTDVCTGWSHTCGIWKEDSSVWCWGRNDLGQLGTGNTTGSAVPVRVSGLGAAVAVACGGDHTCALDDQGRVWCWGLNASGQVGGSIGGQRNSATQVQASLNGHVTWIRLGADFSCAYVDIEGGRIYCWGEGDHGQLGRPGVDSADAHCVMWDDVNCYYETAVPADLAALARGAAEHMCAVQRDGSVEYVDCWGENFYGQLGDGSTGGWSHYMARAMTTSGVQTVEAGDTFTCLARNVPGAPRLYCWGRNNYGQLGLGNTTDHSSPQQVDLPDRTVWGLALGYGFACLIQDDSQGQPELYCWGHNNHGQLGTGNTVGYHVPMSVHGNFQPAKIAAGADHACALAASGILYCWGANHDGQLGVGDYQDRHIPTQVTEP